MFESNNLPDWVKELSGEKFLTTNELNGFRGVKAISIAINLPSPVSFILKPIDRKYVIISRSKFFNHSGLSVYQSLTTKLFYVGVETLINYDCSRQVCVQLINDKLKELPSHVNHENHVDWFSHGPQFYIFGEYQSLNATKKVIKEIGEKYIQPIIDAEKLKERELITDQHGLLCKTMIGSSYTGVNGRQTPKNPAHVRIGDFVVSSNKLYRGWIWCVEQEDLARQNRLRIKPVFCGLEQIDFSKRKMCVRGVDIDLVDTIIVGRAFAGLKTVVEEMMKMKSGDF